LADLRGISCLNVSAMPGGAEVRRPARRMPAPPEMEFSLLSLLVGEVREMLALQLACIRARTAVGRDGEKIVLTQTSWLV